MRAFGTTNKFSSVWKNGFRGSLAKSWRCRFTPDSGVEDIECRIQNSSLRYTALVFRGTRFLLRATSLDLVS